MSENFAARVVRAHEPPAYTPLELRRGDVVSVGAVSDEWPAYRWCVCAAGAGWVPDGVLRFMNGDTAVAVTDYTSREICAAIGQDASIIQRIGGWSFVEIGEQSGWIPDECLQSSEE